MKICRTTMMFVAAFFLVIKFGNVQAATTNNQFHKKEAMIIQPFYEDTRRVSVNLKLSDSIATAVTRVDTLKKCGIAITMKLQKKSGKYWLTIKMWEKNKSNAVSLEVSQNYNVAKGTYRVQSVIASGADTITKTSPTKTLD